MARRFGRSWSAALTLALFFITFATYYTLQPLRSASPVIVEPESRVVLEDQPAVAPVSPDTHDGTVHDGTQSGAIGKEPEKAWEGFREPEPELEVHTAPSPDPSASDPSQTEQASTETPTPAQAEPEIPTPEGPSPTPARQESSGEDLAKPESPDSDESTESPDEPNTKDNEEEQPTEDEEQKEPKGERPPPSKIIVIGRLSTEDTDWVGEELQSWQNAVYLVDLEANETSPTGLRTKMNKAREAMPYLTYIIDHYPHFPDVVAFLHPHRRGMPMAWHTDARGNDAVNMMDDLRLDTVLDRGYVNLRCNNEVGCPDEVQPFRDPPEPKKYAEHAFPYVYGHFFNVTFSTMRDTIPVVATQCCAQFAVSKAQLLKRPKYEYERYRDFLEETHYDDATVGRVMEYMWHIIFGRDAVHCESMLECWCAVYGRCFAGGRGGGFRFGSGRHR